MSADANQFLRDYRNFILTIEKPAEAAWRGTLYHATCAGGMVFETPLEMARLVEDICDESQVPRSLVEDRCFTKRAALKSEDAKAVPKARSYSGSVKGESIQFKICLNHRYNASWQGVIERIGTNNQVVFHSFLQLMEQIMMAFPQKEAVSGTYGQMLAVVNGKGSFDVSKDGMQWYKLPGASYHIKVLYHENYTCQGIVRWLEAKESMCFRSFLELAKMTDVSCAAEIECEELQFG